MSRLGRPGRRLRRVVLTATAAAIVIATPAPASAHPLGNFSVNRLHTITVTPTEVVDEVVVDRAEIPTAQAAGGVDRDGDGETSAAERDVHASRQCVAIAGDTSLVIDGAPVGFSVASSDFVYEAGQAGLSTSRLTCRLVAAASFGDTSVLQLADDARSGRVGWSEINAIGDGVTLIDPAVPAVSITDGLRSYPDDVPPLDIRSVSLTIDANGGVAADAGPATSGAGDARDELVDARPGFVDGTVGRVQDAFDDLIGRRDLTLGVGLLAFGLALVLGASHALLPGHGKTVMAAYIAGRQGSTRDAVVVGATVTATHTGGVLALGTALTLSSALAGDGVLSVLGVASGVLIAALGVGLLVSALRRRHDGWFGHGHHHGPDTHTHDHDHHHDHQHHRHDEHRAHDHEGHAHLPHRDGPMASGTDLAVLERPVTHEHTHHPHLHEADRATPMPTHVSRRGLVGMGVAGGLVPSPSALIILLSAIALGRTWFGILLVVAYGVGMAATLTAAGIALVVLRDRIAQRSATGSGRLASLARRWSRVTPALTALLVVVVGIGLAVRGAASL